MSAKHTKGRFQMQSWSSRELCWEPMEEGAAASVWRPRKTAVEAVAKCLAWTGLLCIPAMQVVDRASGEVVWRGLVDPFEHDGEWHYTDAEAGPPITFAEEKLARSAARARLREVSAEAGRAQAPAAEVQMGLL
jgi:hypothetical protein